MEIVKGLIWLCLLGNIGWISCGTIDSSGEFITKYQDPDSCVQSQNETFSTVLFHCVKCSVCAKDQESTNGPCLAETHSLINGICFSNKAIQEVQIEQKNLYRINFQSGVSIDSQYLKDHLLGSYYSCRLKNNETACQILSNICVLQLYSNAEDSTTACKLHRAIESTNLNKNGLNGNGQYNFLPKLDYSNQKHILYLQKQDLIPYEFTTKFEETSSDVNISVARFTMGGKFMGLEPLASLIPCKEKTETRRISRKFGSTIQIKCKIPVQELMNDIEKNGHGIEFLDPYLSYKNNQKEHHLFSVPIKIMNLERNGVVVNKAEEIYQWELVRRMFIVDTLGGYEKIEGTNSVPRVLRFARTISVRVQLQNNVNPGRIFIPMITVEYEEINSSDFQRNRALEFEYQVLYVMDMDRSIEDIKISIGVITSLGIIWAAFQTWSWNRRCGKADIDIETIVTLLITSCGHIADAFFIVCFCTTLYWFVFFKKQVAVHLLWPQPEQETLVRDLLISAFCLKIVDMIKLIGRQVSVDIFFIDWEKPKVGSVIVHPSAQGKAGGENQRIGEESVSIWRTYFAANEWNEIQSMRKIHLASQIIICFFILEVCGFKNLGLQWPDASLNPGPEANGIPFSTTGRFTIASLVFIGVGIIQWCFRVGFYERYVSNKIQDFVDICTLGNISVFILAARQHGYYIHGRSVHGFADTDMHTMIEQLNREEEDLCGRRGLVPATDQQTFLISVPRSLRQVYDHLLEPLYSSALRGRSAANLQSAKSSTSGFKNKPSSAQLVGSVQAYHCMNKFLIAFLEHALTDIDFDVSEKSFFESTFDMEFNEVGSQRAVFYTDNGHSFDSVLFYGNERTMFMFDLYLFIFVDLLSHNFVLAGIITFVVDVILKYIRNYLGKRNIAYKTLIDGRFLI